MAISEGAESRPNVPVPSDGAAGRGGPVAYDTNDATGGHVEPPPLPEGQSYLVDEDGAYLVDDDGALLTDSAERGEDIGIEPLRSERPVVELALGESEGPVPENALTFDGEPITIGGEFITIGGDSEVELIPPDGQEFLIGRDGQHLVGRDGSFLTSARRVVSEAETSASQTDAAVDSSSWTGARSPRALAVQVRAMVPTFQAALSILIEDYERPGDNEGPPLDERAQILLELRELHSALGRLLDSIDRPEWEGGHGGLLIEATRLAANIRARVTEKPLQYATIAVVEVTLGALGLPGAGIATELIMSSTKKAGTLRPSSQPAL